ncbi:MAG TPA: ABC transporter permease [Cytophagales bacterium]|nr:ABC transporter permease [Cytophagales bacterium]
MLFLIAWRNIWRSRSRSLVVMGAVTVGIVAVVFIIGFMNSYLDGFSANSVHYDFSHIQMHDSTYLEDEGIEYLIDDAESTIGQVASLPGVVGVSGRLRASGMMSSSGGASGVVIAGIDPEAENATTALGEKIKSGAYFEGIKRNPILVSRIVADKLGLKERSKVVLNFQDVEGNPVAASFRVVGTFSTASARFNQGWVFVRQSDLARLLGTDNQVHEVAIYLESNALLEANTAELRADFPDYASQTWIERAPAIAQVEEQTSASLGIIVGIVMLALVFGIINTMLMAVLERVHELGMLMAVGMTRRRVFAMIMLETFMLSLMGAPFGILIGTGLITYLGRVGIDFSAQADALEQFGFDAIFYPSLNPEDMITVAVAIMITALVGSIFPARRAVKLKPVEALRHV